MSETDSGSGDGSQSKRATFAGTAEDIVEVISEHVTSADWISKNNATKKKVLKHGLLMRALHALMPFLNFQKLKMAKAIKATLAKNRGGGITTSRSSMSKCRWREQGCRTSVRTTFTAAVQDGG